MTYKTPAQQRPVLFKTAKAAGKTSYHGGLIKYADGVCETTDGFLWVSTIPPGLFGGNSKDCVYSIDKDGLEAYEGGLDQFPNKPDMDMKPEYSVNLYIRDLKKAARAAVKTGNVRRKTLQAVVLMRDPRPWNTDPDRAALVATCGKHAIILPAHVKAPREPVWIPTSLIGRCPGSSLKIQTDYQGSYRVTVYHEAIETVEYVWKAGYPNLRMVIPSGLEHVADMDDEGTVGKCRRMDSSDYFRGRKLLPAIVTTISEGKADLDALRKLGWQGRSLYCKSEAPSRTAYILMED